MEKQLDNVMDKTMQYPNVMGCIFANSEGLCLGTRGLASANSAGIITGIATEASKLDSQSVHPVIVLETDTKSCIIQKRENITGAVYKSTSNL